MTSHARTTAILIKTQFVAGLGCSAQVTGVEKADKDAMTCPGLTYLNRPRNNSVGFGFRRLVVTGYLCNYTPQVEMSRVPSPFGSYAPRKLAHDHTRTLAYGGLEEHLPSETFRNPEKFRIEDIYLENYGERILCELLA